MKKQLLFLFSALFVFSLSFGQSNTDKNKEKSSKSANVASVNKQLTKKQAKAVRKKHAKNLAKSPFKKIDKINRGTFQLARGYSTSSGGPSSLSCLALITSGQVIVVRPLLIA